jgi:hypothetical protein
MRLLLHPVEALRSSRRWLVRTAATGCFGRLALRPSPALPVPPTAYSMKTPRP